MTDAWTYLGVSIVVVPPLSRHVVHSHMYKSRPPSTMSDIVPRKVRSWAASRSLRRTWGSRRSGTGRGSRR
ncbi:hypothetical protein HBI49_204280 [Parastagonospora nodorum]|nr:hypothetical protein HBI49_204280 [Parastagonospora nodorum]